jgi:hypothetical protein
MTATAPEPVPGRWAISRCSTRWQAASPTDRRWSNFPSQQCALELGCCLLILQDTLNTCRQPRRLRLVSPLGLDEPS